MKKVLGQEITEPGHGIYFIFTILFVAVHDGLIIG